ELGRELLDGVPAALHDCILYYPIVLFVKRFVFGRFANLIRAVRGPPLQVLAEEIGSRGRSAPS
ncbi:MAG: hypothetical protein M3317_12640, partial [Actinomycetota bacterium]|nr:hypothetical protein [Actinomycetota bacterium]